jgi:hypothetical protein
MAVSNGPKGFEVSESEDGVRRATRPTQAPVFARPGEPEPRVVGGYGLEDTIDRRTFAVKPSRP